MKYSRCLIFCCIVVLAHGAPAAKDRRVSRDLDKIDGLRARLLRLQNQIQALEGNEGTSKNTEGGRETGSRAQNDDVSAEDDVSKLREGAEDQMTSARQQHVQKLARTLGDNRESNLKTLASTLRELLVEQQADEADRAADQAPQRANTAGDYLGDSYNKHKNPALPLFITDYLGDSYNKHENLPPATHRDKEEEKEEEEETADDGDDKYDVAIDNSRLRNIYSMLMRMYNEQESNAVAMGTRNRPQQHRYTPDSPRPTSYHSVPVVHVDEGAFGDFVDDTADDSRPLSAAALRSSSPRAEHNVMRDAVLAAVETKLLNDVQDARTAGISVNDIIKDIQRKAADEQKREQLKEIERELSSLSRKRL
ncbi:hypothetical protein V1264_011178 [Littorina saxatilis]|uniref:Uncharacterized protein n=1 Tax=Littorina saxatilis TaxID=31220 RepID=A0AAN9BUG3_9CAEN